MNIGDLVTQVHDDSEDADAQPLHINVAASTPPPPPPEDDDKETSQPPSCWHFLCCRKSTRATKHSPSPPSKPDSSSNSSLPPTISTSGIAVSAPTNSVALQPRPQQTFASNNIVTAPPQKFLLNPLPPEDVGKKCLVLDLDETLVHSSFKPIPNADFVISIELESVTHRVYVRKRPGVDHFLRAVGDKFEVVIFTASLSKYADPLLDILDRSRIVKYRLFREACVQHYGNYVKDLSHLGRKMEHILIVDNSPFSYMFQPDNAIPITSWFNDKNDRQLYELLPFLDSMLAVDDVYTVLQKKKPEYGSGIGVPPNLMPNNNGQ